MKHQYWLLTGGYTKADNKGINIYRFDDGVLQLAERIESRDPAFIAASSDGKYIAAANESGGDQNAVSIFSFDATNGKMEALHQLSTGKLSPCHISFDKTDRLVFAAYYGGGGLSVFSFDHSAEQLTEKKLFQYHGSSIVTNRQEASHVHCASPDYTQDILYSCDLGTDEIRLYNIEAKKQSITELPSHKVTPGNGPRSVAFHPVYRYMYVVNELAGTVDVFDNHEHELRLLQTISTDNTDYKDKGSGAILLSNDGNFLYVTNRGKYNTISTYAVDIATGKLQLLKTQPTMGITPRHALIDASDNYLFIANQGSQSIAIFKRDVHTGLLEHTHTETMVNNPACVLLIERK